MGLQYEGEIEIVEFHNMIESEAQEENPDEESDPVELNSLEFFIKALSYFVVEANGQLSSSEQNSTKLPWSEAKLNDSTSTQSKPLYLQNTTNGVRANLLTTR